MLKKALETNGCNLSDFAEPNWNICKLKESIAILEKEIEELRHYAFGSNCEKYDNMITIRSGIFDNKGVITTGLDIDLLQAKLGRLDSMKVRLKSLEPLKK